jgi:hypothetical protein
LQSGSSNVVTQFILADQMTDCVRCESILRLDLLNQSVTGILRMKPEIKSNQPLCI